MKTSHTSRALRLALALALAASFFAAPAAAQQYGPLERGWRTGYSDGYQAGWGDSLRSARRDYRASADYQRADRAYIASYGSLEDYRNGYQQGFEVGYEAGYARQGFDSNLPAGGVRRRGATAADASGGATNPARTDDDDDESGSSSGDRGGGVSSTGGARAVASGTVLLVELSNRLSTDVSQRGDRFEARVLEPQEFAGAVVSGRLAEVQRPGKTRGRALLQLEFDQIQMPGGGWEEFSAQVVEVVPTGDDKAGSVDPEGGVRGKSSTKDDVAKVGAGAGIGAIIGAIAGGGKGAGIGAVIGASVGTAGVMTQRGKDIRFERGQQLRIRSTGRTR
jgi:hypothetical protein